MGGRRLIANSRSSRGFVLKGSGSMFKPIYYALLVLVLAVPAIPQSRPKAAQPQARPKLQPHRISLSNGKAFDLYLPEGFNISVAAQGLKRVRFMALSPDNRIFVTDMYTRADNRRGKVLILEGFDRHTGKFARIT